MTAVFRKQGNIITVAPREAFEFLPELPTATYVLKSHPDIGIYFEIVDDFEMPGKIYGDVKKRAHRILTTFNDRPKTTGVLLSGEKGSGKTLLARQVSIDARAKGIPTVIINSPFHGDEFNSFVQSIHQPIVFLFDEFEKVYDGDDQSAVLTLLDGVFPTKKLFMLTCNDRFKLSAYTQNRPGRIYYLIEFSGIDDAFITEYAQDKLKESLQPYIPELLQVTSLFANFNFDMLQAIVEEMNRYDEKPQDVIRILNTKPELNFSKTYDIELYDRGVQVSPKELAETQWRGRPLDRFQMYIFRDKLKRDVSEKNDNESKKSNTLKTKDLSAPANCVTDCETIANAEELKDDSWEEISVEREHMIGFGNKTFIFKPTANYEVIFREHVVNEWDWRSSMGGY